MDTKSLCLRPTRVASLFFAHLLAPLGELLAEAFSGGVYTKLRLLDVLDVPAGGRVLDVGTGRGVLPVLLLGARPDLTVAALDADPVTLQAAHRDARRAAVRVRFGAGHAERLPFASQQFDAVVSTLTLHHLPSQGKSAACREFARVLKPNGTFYLADFAPAKSAWARWASIVPRLTCFPHVYENFRGRIPPLLRGAGFVRVEELFQTAASVSLFRARLRT